MKDGRRNTQSRTNTKEYHKPVRIVPARLKLRMSRDFRKMPGTTQKLLVAMFRIKRYRLTAWGNWSEVKDKKRKNNSNIFFFTKRQDLSAEESRINIVQIILKLKLEKQKVSGHLEALKSFHT